MYAKHLTQCGLMDCFINCSQIELGVKGRMFAMIKALYTDVESFVYFKGVSSQAFPLYQGSGQGRILAPFMYKVYINRLIETVCNSKCSLVIDKLRMLMT